MRKLRPLVLLLFVVVQGAFPRLGVGAEPTRTLAVVSPYEKGGRVAIVIGNSNYPSGALANPKNDANAMAGALKKLGFDVELRLDATKIDIDELLQRFSAKAEKAAVAALFYAGHGIQVSGSNYLVPIGANPRSEKDLKRDMVKMDDVIDDMGGARVKLVFFDACRDNPLSRSFSRGTSRGMAAPVEATGTLISFATKHGNTAADGEGDHSPYTKALLAALENPTGLEIEQLLRRVQQGVKSATDGQQEPWRYGSLDGDFYFVPSAFQKENAKLQQDAIDRAVQDALKKASQSTSADLTYWESVKNSKNVDDFNAYLKKYPKGSFADLAQSRISTLEREIRKEGRTKPVVVPGGTDQITVELAFWDSIKNTNSVDDLKEYLASYPSGRFTGLARNRIRNLEASPEQPAARPAQQAATSVQRLNSSPSPRPISANAVASGYPQQGDSWTYRFIDAWKKDSLLTVVVQVAESEDDKVTDRMSLKGSRSADERTYEGRPDAVERSVGRDVRITELLPYAQSLIRDGLKPGQEKSFPNIDMDGQTYRIAAKYIGQEKVVVPAGTFDAVRVDIVGRRLGAELPNAMAGIASSIAHTVWFAPDIRRAIKVAHKTGNPYRTVLDDSTLELVSFQVSGPARLNGEDPISEKSHKSLPADSVALSPR